MMRRGIEYDSGHIYLLKMNRNRPVRKGDKSIPRSKNQKKN